MSISKGLKFKKLDLHVHSPASTCYKDRSAKPEDIVSAAISQGLAAIAITDHHTAKGIDGIKKAANGKDLVVFPGVELKVHGGEKGIHLIVLFGPDKDEKHISQFLNTLEVYDHNGNPDSIANVTPVAVAEHLEKYDPEGLLILAHCHSSAGLMGEEKGGQRSAIFKPRFKCLVGAEASEGDFKNKEKAGKHVRIIDLLDGSDVNFHNKKMGVYQSSDAHSLAEIGAKYSYFKVDNPITIEDIRQCLIDRDTRIRQPFEYAEAVFPHVNSIKITSGFLNDQSILFHEGLNSLLGGKGAGKSLVVEFLRFALNQESENSEIREDHDLKLEKCLKLHGEVEVVFIDDSGKEYLIKRTYNPDDDNPINITDLSDGSKKDFEVRQAFPALFLSQNEIIKIAEDKTGGNQRRFIDMFFDFRRHQIRIERLNKLLSEIDRKFADSLKSHLASLDLQKKISTIKEEVDKLGRQITNQVFEEYSKQERIGQTIKNQIDFLAALLAEVSETISSYKDLAPPITGEKEIDSSPAVKRALGLSKKAIDELVGAIGKQESDLKQAISKIKDEFDDWGKGFKSIKSKYEKIVSDSGGTQLVLDKKRKKLIRDLAELEKYLASYKKKAQQVSSITTKRREIIDQLDVEYKNYFNERKERCDFFSEHSAGSLKVVMKEREDKSVFRTNLNIIKKGSWVKDEDIDGIARGVSPRDFIDNILRFEWLERKKNDPLKKIAAATKIKLDNIVKLAYHLLDEYDYKDILALLYTSVPKDVPIIKYNVGDTFKKLDELSVGQKATALLVIALSDGAFPIVIDQPEDSLDLRTIWEDVCEKLRGTKDNRQFIFTTHNSSVAVASDTDKFTILLADAHKGKVLHSGSLNICEIKKEVVKYLEGGKDTYKTKRLKYNL